MSAHRPQRGEKVTPGVSRPPGSAQCEGRGARAGLSWRCPGRAGSNRRTESASSQAARSTQGLSSPAAASEPPPLPPEPLRETHARHRQPVPSLRGPDLAPRRAQVTAFTALSSNAPSHAPGLLPAPHPPPQAGPTSPSGRTLSPPCTRSYRPGPLTRRTPLAPFPQPRGPHPPGREPPRRRAVLRACPAPAPGPFVRAPGWRRDWAVTGAAPGRNLPVQSPRHKASPWRPQNPADTSRRRKCLRRTTFPGIPLASELHFPEGSATDLQD